MAPVRRASFSLAALLSMFAACSADDPAPTIDLGAGTAATAGTGGVPIDGGWVEQDGSHVDADITHDSGGTGGTGGASGASGSGGTSGTGGSGGIANGGLDCPAATTNTLPASSPHVLVLGPTNAETLTIAAHLQGLLSADPSLTAPVVTGATIESAPDTVSGVTEGQSLMYFFYAPDGRATRLAALSSPLTHVVMLEQSSYVTQIPELYFEGVRVIGCAARAVGAAPIVLMSWGDISEDPADRAAITYRIANGTGAVVSPAGVARHALANTVSPSPARDAFLAASSLYTTITANNANGSSYVPSGLASPEVSSLAQAAFDAETSEATTIHYTTPYKGPIQVGSWNPGPLAFTSWGTSSEALWNNQMNAILPKAGFAANGSPVTATNTTKTCDQSCVDAMTPNLQAKPYQLAYARDYSISASTLQSIGSQPDLQAQVWDRHADNIPSDGAAAVGRLEYMFTTKYNEAKSLGLVYTPYHLMYSRLKTLLPDQPITSDGTHATNEVSYGQATMSIVSRTGVSPPLDGLDAPTATSATLADQTIRQLSSLSSSGLFVSDDPATRPHLH